MNNEEKTFKIPHTAAVGTSKDNVDALHYIAEFKNENSVIINLHINLINLVIQISDLFLNL